MILDESPTKKPDDKNKTPILEPGQTRKVAATANTAQRSNR